MADIGVLAGAGVAGRTSVTGAIDPHGGVMVLVNVGGGGIAPVTTSAGMTAGLSNAPSVKSLPGNSVQLGGAFGVPAAVTGEVSMFRDQSSGVPYYSVLVGGAAVAQPGVAVWGTAEHSAQVWEYSIFDQLDAFYDWYIRLWFGE